MGRVLEELHSQGAVLHTVPTPNPRQGSVSRSDSIIPNTVPPLSLWGPWRRLGPSPLSPFSITEVSASAPNPLQWERR